MVRGYIQEAGPSICMDNCSIYWLDPDPGFEEMYLTADDPFSLNSFLGMYVELWGNMTQCTMCESLNVTDVIILDEVPPNVYQGYLDGPNWNSFCMDGCDEFYLFDEDENFITNLTTMGNYEIFIDYVGQNVEIFGIEIQCVECSGVLILELSIIEDECITDYNGDGNLNILDILVVVNCILTTADCDDCMDINEDDNINIMDLIEMINMILNPILLPEECYEETEMGPCEALIPVYEFNENTGQCEMTYYGGCEGNVPFWTEEECEELCE